MKYLPVLLFAMIIVQSSCMRNEYLVESDYSYLGKFKNYKTFQFMTEIGVNQDSVRQREIVRDEILKRMELQGYAIEEKKPDLLVSYKIFLDRFDFQGYDQPNMETWLSTEDQDEEYDKVTYNMYKGTIVVLFWDRKRSLVVWQGYASTVFDNPYRNDKYLKWAVRSIFDQYRVFGENLSAANKIY